MFRRLAQSVSHQWFHRP